jgi:hypothetical protein
MKKSILDLVLCCLVLLFAHILDCTIWFGFELLSRVQNSGDFLLPISPSGTGCGDFSFVFSFGVRTAVAGLRIAPSFWLRLDRVVRCSGSVPKICFCSSIFSGQGMSAGSPMACCSSRAAHKESFFFGVSAAHVWCLPWR